MYRRIWFLLFCLILSILPSTAMAGYTSKTVLANGSYPTAAPSSLSANAITAPGGYTSVDVAITVTAGSGTISLLCYELASAKWWPIGDVSVDATSYAVGGTAYNHGRFTPGDGCASFLLWTKTAGATVGTAYLGVGIRRD